MATLTHLASIEYRSTGKNEVIFTEHEDMITILGQSGAVMVIEGYTLKGKDTYTWVQLLIPTDRIETIEIGRLSEPQEVEI
jgi:hypothetical protein